MKTVVLRGKSKKDLLELLKEEWVKKLGASLRESLGSYEGPFLVVKADEETIKRLLDTGKLEIPENEEELVKIVEEDEERSTAGVGLLGL